MPARIGGPREGVVFVPFHYGYWDVGDGAGPDGQPRAANELTITLWDPVSKQPRFKTAAVKVEQSMKIGPLLAHLEELEVAYAETLRQRPSAFERSTTCYHQCLTFAAAADQAATKLAPLRQRYDGKPNGRPLSPGHGETLLEELRSLYLMAHAVAVTWAMALQAAKAAARRRAERGRRATATPRPRRRPSGS